MSTVARIPNVKAQSFKNIDFKALLQSIHEPQEYAAKPNLPLFTCGPLSGERTPVRMVNGKKTGGAVRHDDAITALTIAIGDHDNGTMTMDAAADKLRAAGIEATLYTTPSHTRDKPRWRVVVRLARQVPKRSVDALKALYQRVVAYLDHLLGGDVLKSESYTLSQSFYYGRVAGVEYQVIDVPGKRLDAMKAPSVLRPKTRTTPPPNSNGGDNYLNEFLIAAREEATYHQGLLRLSASYLGRGYSREDAIRMTQEAMQLAPARGDKWQMRFDDIPRMVEGAITKGIGTVVGTMPVRRAPSPPQEVDPEAPDVPLFKLESTATLMQEAFAPVECVLDGRVRFSVGAYLLTGKPKRGKSWMALGFALAMVGDIAEYLASKPASGMSALYIACDDPSRSRFARRMKAIAAATSGRLHLMTDIDRARTSSIEVLDAAKQMIPGLRFVVIDTLSAFREGLRSESVYQQEYDELKALNDWAHANDCVVLVVHHLRKGAVDPADPFESISGTLGLQGAVDGMVVIERKDFESDFDESLDEKLAGAWFKSRDFEEYSFGMRLHDGQWRIVGTTADVFSAGTNREILRILNEQPDVWMSSIEIHRAGDFDCKPASVRKACMRLAKRRVIESRRGGENGGAYRAGPK